jgi:hypothetical protein
MGSRKICSDAGLTGVSKVSAGVGVWSKRTKAIVSKQRLESIDWHTARDDEMETKVLENNYNHPCRGFCCASPRCSIHSK